MLVALHGAWTCVLLLPFNSKSKDCALDFNQYHVNQCRDRITWHMSVPNASWGWVWFFQRSWGERHIGLSRRGHLYVRQTITTSNSWAHKIYSLILKFSINEAYFYIVTRWMVAKHNSRGMVARTTTLCRLPSPAEAASAAATSRQQFLTRRWRRPSSFFSMRIRFMITWCPPSSAGPGGYTRWKGRVNPRYEDEMTMGHERPPTSILTPDAAPVDCRLPLRRMEDDAMPRAAEEEVASRPGPRSWLRRLSSSATHASLPPTMARRRRV